MAITSVFANDFIQLQVRSYIINNISIQDAGYWQGITKISTLYLTFLTSTLAIYYLPRFSEIKRNDELRKEVKKGFMYLLPLTILPTILLYVFRSFIVNMLFAKSFLPMVTLFPMQLLGNIFRVLSWLFGFIIVAKAMTRTFIIMELVSGSSFYLLSRLFVNRYGVVGATYSYALSNLIYLVIMVLIVRHIFFKKSAYAQTNNDFGSDRNL
jgi:PST family polysaccharide transporter